MRPTISGHWPAICSQHSQIIRSGAWPIGLNHLPNGKPIEAPMPPPGAPRTSARSPSSPICLRLG